MYEKDIRLLTKLVEKKCKENITKKDALASLQRAGIFDKNGKYTAPYQNLARARKKNLK